MPNNIQKTNRHTMDFIRRMRRSAISAGRPDGLIREIAWKAGRLEVIYLHGQYRPCTALRGICLWGEYIG